jgi:hypothetical protein
MRTISLHAELTSGREDSLTDIAVGQVHIEKTVRTRRGEMHYCSDCC